jgi:hypothetical protein
MALISVIFQQVPIYLVFTSVEKETLFCVFLSFTNLSDVKRTQSFSGIIFWGIQLVDEEVEQKTSEAQDMAHHTSTALGHVVGPIWSLVAPFGSFFMATDSP